MVISKNDLKEFSSLKRKSKRLELGLFLVEGIKNCEELVASDYEVVAVLTTNNLNQALERCGGKHGDKGLESAQSLLQIISVSKS